VGAAGKEPTVIANGADAGPVPHAFVAVAVKAPDVAFVAKAAVTPAVVPPADTVKPTPPEYAHENVEAPLTTGTENATPV
jgi:hypothetical protein